MREVEVNKCWIFGDEAGELGKDRFFAIGILGTRNPLTVVEELRALRRKTNFFGEVSYKSNDSRRALCAIRWMDWLFSKQQLVSFKILLKDTETFKTSYFKDNFYKTGARQLAYCESYKEVLRNFAGFEADKKILTYSQIGLAEMNVAEYLDGKVSGIERKHCFPGNCRAKKPNRAEFTATAELLQLADLLTSSLGGLCRALANEGTNKDWVRRTLQLNLVYHIPELREKILSKRSMYWPTFEPYEDQIFVLYYWKESFPGLQPVKPVFPQ